MKKLHAKNQT